MQHSRKRQSELLERYIFLAGEKKFCRSVGYWIGFALKQKYMGVQTDRSQSFVRKSQFREKLAHMTGRQKQQKNRIWWNRPATQSLAAVGGALTPSFQAYKKPYDLESLSGKPVAIWGCQKYEKFCIWGVTTGNSGQDVCPRPAEVSLD